MPEQQRSGATNRPGDEAPLDVRTVVGILLAVLGGFLALGAAIPVLPPFVRGPLAGGDVAVGLVIGATALAAIVARPAAGRLAQQRGRRRLVLVGLGLTSAAGALYLLPAGVAGLVMARLLLGVGEGCVFTAAAVWIVSLSPPSRRGQLVGLTGLSLWTGLTLGSVIGPALRSWLGYDAVWAFTILAPALSALVALRLTDRFTPLPAQPIALLPRAAIRPGIALGLASAGYAVLAAFVVLHLQARGVASGALALTAFGTAYVAARALGGRLPDRFGARPVALACGAGEAAGLAVIATSSTLGVAIAGAVLMGLGFSLLYPSLALMVIESTSEAERGAAIGAYTSFWDLGLGAGGPAMGAIAAAGGYPGAFVAGAVCAAAAGVVAFGGRALLGRGAALAES